MNKIINENGWKYYVENNEAYIIGRPKAEGYTLFIPETLGGYPVACYNFYMASSYDYKAVHLSKNTRIFDAACLSENIKRITVDENNPHFTSRDGILYSRDFRTLVSFPPAKEDFDPSCLKGVEIIDEGAFSCSDNIRSLVIPESVKEIRDFAFADCMALEHIEMPDSVKAIGKSVFNRSSLKSIRLSKNIKALDLSYVFDGEGEGFFSGTDLTEITIPEGIEVIGDLTFDSCKELRRVYIPSSVKEIGHYVFSECDALEEVIVSENNENYYSKDGVLYSMDGTLLLYPAGKKATEFAVPYETAKIAAYAFYKCQNLKKLTLHDDVTEIGYRAFTCSSIEKINIPRSVKAIEKDVFLYTDIKELYIHKEVEFIEVNSGTAGNINPFKDMTLIVHKGSYAEKICKEHNCCYKVIE